jgi:hypothetical protein
METLNLKIVSIVLVIQKKRFGFKGTYNNTSGYAFLPVWDKKCDDG